MKLNRMLTQIFLIMLLILTLYSKKNLSEYKSFLKENSGVNEQINIKSKKSHLKPSKSNSFLNEPQKCDNHICLCSDNAILDSSSLSLVIAKISLLKPFFTLIKVQ